MLLRRTGRTLVRSQHLALVGLAAFALVSCSSAHMAGHGVSEAPLAREVRQATERYQDVKAATAAGYAPFLGCVSSPQDGAMGIHYVNGDLVGDGKLDVARPEALMYEQKGDKLELVGVEYIVIASAWDAASKTPPTLMGQLFHYGTSPNRYGIPAYYALHVWAWKANPHGVFMDWNPRVSCEEHRVSLLHR
jgi:hypothetical protein